MQISNLHRRVSTLETEVRRLYKELLELKSNGGTPKFVNLAGAHSLFGIGVSTLRFRCNTGAYKGIAFKEKGVWLIDVAAFERRIKSANQ